MFVRLFPKLEHNNGGEHNIGGGRQVVKTYKTSFHCYTAFNSAYTNFHF